MATERKDRVKDTTTTTGTGTLTLTGNAPDGFRSFASAHTASATVNYIIVMGTEWEVGTGVYSANTLTRASVYASSNAGALVNFSAGTKTVASGPTAQDIDGAAQGPASATDSSLARFDGTTGKLLKDGAVIGTDVVGYGGALGTPTSGTLTNCTGLPQVGVTGLTTADSPQFTGINLGHASDTTLTRVSAGKVAVEGVTLADLGANTFTGIQRWAKGADVASVNALTLGTDGNYFDITGTTAITSIGTLGIGTVIKLHFDGILTFTHHATDLILPGAANITTAAGDEAEFVEYATGAWRCTCYTKASGSGTQIQPISASVAANALTISASALSLDFRSATLGSGAVTTVTGTPANLVISSGSTLGTVSAVQSRIAVIAMNNAGTIELAAVNISGGNDLSETGVISTTAEGGAGAADSANVVYSATARSSLAYRVIGYVESTQATAGTWATAPSTIQGAGGNAVTAMSSLGYGQTFTNFISGGAGSGRALSTTYYNTTGKPIFVFAELMLTTTSSIVTVTIGATSNQSYSGAPAQSRQNITFIVPPGMAYSIDGVTGTLDSWAELR